MFIKKGKTNWMMIVVVALVAGAVGEGAVMYINDTAQQTQELSQSVGVINPQKIQSGTPETNTIQQNNDNQENVPAPDGTGAQQ